MMCRMEIPSQNGRVAIVTGATGGLGSVVARSLASAGARVVLAVRDPGRRPSIRGDVMASRLDLSDLESVREFVAGAPARIDLLINNAGIMGVPRRLSAQGQELQFAVNHLGHFALTTWLLDRLAADARVVTVTSTLARGGRIDFDDLTMARRYRTTAAYNRSKLANSLFGVELQRRLAAAGSSVRSVLAHPGYAATNIQSNGPTRLYRFLLTRVGNPLFAASAEDGARPLLYAATDPSVRGGELIGPDGLGQMRGKPAVLSPVPRALDPDLARRLWTVSEELVGTATPSATDMPAGASTADAVTRSRACGPPAQP
jgi:NAD(P)-dependent dehydrogenase (short-subunit alcohol dehydrogenase family)